jgi:hypothetical protein
MKQPFSTNYCNTVSHLWSNTLAIYELENIYALIGIQYGSLMEALCQTM